MSELPSYRQYLLLAALPGWRSTATALTLDLEGTYRLDPLPGAAAPLRP